LIENTVIGGPAHNSKAIAQGDTILKIDGVDASAENVRGLLLGSDVPGSPVVVTIAKTSPQVFTEVINFRSKNLPSVH
jgi:C-terminal processing protease CtpA/Prc